MNAGQLDHYRKILEKQLAHLTEVTGNHEDILEESRTTNDIVVADRAAELESFEVDASIAASASAKAPMATARPVARPS